MNITRPARHQVRRLLHRHPAFARRNGSFRAVVFVLVSLQIIILFYLLLKALGVF